MVLIDVGFVTLTLQEMEESAHLLFGGSTPINMPKISGLSFKPFPTFDDNIEEPQVCDLKSQLSECEQQSNAQQEPFTVESVRKTISKVDSDSDSCKISLTKPLI
jgi:hypothetical protein